MNRQQKQRAFIVLAAGLAVLVLGRHLTKRGGLPQPRDVETAKGSTSVSAKLAPGQATSILRTARQLLEGQDVDRFEESERPGEHSVVLSLSRRQQTALVAPANGDSLHEALSEAAADLAQRATPEEIRWGRLKVDLVQQIRPGQAFGADGLATIDRSREGLWLPEDDLLLLPEELLSRRLVSSSGTLARNRLRRYLAEGGRSGAMLGDQSGREGSTYHPVDFESFMEGNDGLALRLYRGNNRSPDISPDALLAASVAGGDYLLRHLKEDGWFNYIYEPKKDSYTDDYNLLRHAGTCYSLVQLFGATADQRYLQAARKGLETLLETTSPPKPDHRSANFEAIVSPGKEAKLGGAALALLALVEYGQASGDSTFADRTQPLARFLRFQQGDDGRFESKYFYGRPDAKPFESIYYPGEAILALTRLYRVDPRQEWLTTARRGADWLINVRDAGKETADLPHDHWLLMGLNELHQLTGESLYLAHATRIAQAIVEAQRIRSPQIDWVGSFYDPPRSTPTATRAEGLVAMVALASRADADIQPLLAALMRMAAFQLRTQLTPESALYLPRPDLALGGFRRSLTNWQVRIDYVQHNLSALLGLRQILIAQSQAPRTDVN